jgi:hypothetical protein
MMYVYTLFNKLSFLKNSEYYDFDDDEEYSDEEEDEGPCAYTVGAPQ